MSAIVPISKIPITVRPATAADLPFIDALQKMHTFMVGFLHRKALEQKVGDGRVLIAEEGIRNQEEGVRNQESGIRALNPESCLLNPRPLGYSISTDQYMGRDDVGIVYQLNVAPMQQRNLIGASLVKAVLERSAYGCRLFGCWCAQDLPANYFWQSLGFVPLAFRMGCRARQRLHIYWQCKVRAGPGGAGGAGADYWYPCETRSGAFKEDRLVFPIPPEVHWRDVVPVKLPGMDLRSADLLPAAPVEVPKQLPVAQPQRPQLSRAQKAVIQRSQSAHLQGVPLGKKAVLTPTGIKYIERTDFVPELDTPEELKQPAKPKRAPKPPAAKLDPKLLSTVRELRDRCLEQLNCGELIPQAKYAVARLEASDTAIAPPPTKILAA